MRYFCSTAKGTWQPIEMEERETWGGVVGFVITKVRMEAGR